VRLPELSDWGFHPDSFGNLLLSISTGALLPYIFSICLAVQCVLVNGSWGKVERRSIIIAGCLLLLGISLYIMSTSWFLNLEFGATILRTNFSINSDRTIDVHLLYFNTGFFLAIISILFMFISCVRPVLVFIPIKIKLKKIEGLGISAKKKVIILLSNSLIVTLLFALFHLDLLHTFPVESKVMVLFLILACSWVLSRLIIRTGAY
jgi:hypothetical protein